MSRRYLILLPLLLLFFASCSVSKTVPLVTIGNFVQEDNLTSFIDNETLSRIKESNKHYSFYTGKALIEFFDGSQLHKISALIKMENSSEIVIKFLGLFNIVAATLTYSNGSVDFINNRGGVDIDIKRIVDDYDLPQVLSFLDTTITTPNTTDYSPIDTDIGRVLFGDNITVTINKESYKVEVFNNKNYIAIYEKTDDGRIKKVVINNLKSNIHIAIEFLNSSNWKTAS